MLGKLRHLVHSCNANRHPDIDSQERQASELEGDVVLRDEDNRVCLKEKAVCALSSLNFEMYELIQLTIRCYTQVWSLLLMR